MSETNKGLLNLAGKYECFLNFTIEVSEYFSSLSSPSHLPLPLLFLRSHFTPFCPPVLTCTCSFDPLSLPSSSSPLPFSPPHLLPYCIYFPLSIYFPVTASPPFYYLSPFSLFLPLPSLSSFSPFPLPISSHFRLFFSSCAQ